MRRLAPAVRARLARREPWNHGRYLVRIGGSLVGLALAVAFHAASLGNRLADAAQAAQRRAPGGSTADAGLAALAYVRYGLDVDPRDVVWVEAAHDFGIASALDPARHRRAVFAGAAAPGSARDVFVVDVASAGGVPVRASLLRNLTVSPAGDEGDLTASGDLVAYVRRAGDGPPSVVVLDTAGDDPALTAGWSPSERFKDAVTSFQETGRLAGINRAEFALAEAPAVLRLSWEGRNLAIETDAGRAVVTPLGAVLSGTALVASASPMTKARRGTTAWAVDTVRAWVGPEPIEALEYLFFKVTDRYRMATTDAADAAAEIERSLATSHAPGRTAQYELVLDEDIAEMEIGWPPPRIGPFGAHDPMAGEGEWMPATDEDFVLNEPGMPPTFVTTFLRTDPERPYSVVYVAAWDPRRVTLHPAAGSIEPKAATGETATGMIPRDDSTIRGLVAGFNGGFQALHGEFGLMQDGRLFLPPKPWGGMVFLLRGGRAAVGTWPGPDENVAIHQGAKTYDQDPNGVDEPALERFLRDQGVVSFRQNLTPLFGHGMINPYRRRWWGSSPKDMEDPNPVTVRSAICRTGHGHMAYFYGLSTNLDALVAAMEAAACAYGLHLDMNSGHVGWEFYRIVDAGEPPPRELRAGFQAEGVVPGRPDLRFRARRLFQGMDLFRFPRYVQREPRDYFYLVLERSLPLPDIEGDFAGEQDGRWTQRGLPVRTFPPAVTLAGIPAGDEAGSRVYVAAIDPRWTRAAAWDPAVLGAANGCFAAFVPVAGSPSVWRGRGDAPFSPDDAVLLVASDPLGLEDKLLVDRWSNASAAAADRPVVLAVRGTPLSEASTGRFAGAFGAIRGERFLLYAEVRTGDGAALYRALRGAGADRAIGVAREDALGWVFVYARGNGAGPEQRPLTRPDLASMPLDGALGFSLSPAPAVIDVLEATQVVPPGEWNPPHTRRIRYFRTDDHHQRALRSYR